MPEIIIDTLSRLILSQAEQIYPVIVTRLPLFSVFLSGVGFSIQTLIIKTLSEEGFRASFQFVFVRGIMQMVLSSAFVFFYRTDSDGAKPAGLFGDTNHMRLIIVLRSLVGFSSISFSFLAVEKLPLGDASVLVMLAPIVASIASFFILGEPWRKVELCATCISLVGAILVARPPLIFDENQVEHDDGFYMGVLFALLAAVSAGFAYICIRILGTTAKMPWANICFVQAIGQFVLSLPCQYLAGQRITILPTVHQCAMLAAGGIIGAVSQIMMTLGMQREKSAAATAMRMSDVVFGFVWQSLFTQDPVSILSVTGAVLVASSILIVVVFKQMQGPAGDRAEYNNPSYRTMVSFPGTLELHSVVREHCIDDKGSFSLLHTNELDDDHDEACKISASNN